MTREDEIFRKIEQGDSGGLDELVSLYYPEILRYCRWHTPDQATAEDAAQETFLKAVRHFDRYVHKGRFKGPSRRRISPGWWNGCPKSRGKSCCSGLPRILRCGKPPMSWGFRCGRYNRGCAPH